MKQIRNRLFLHFYSGILMVILFSSRSASQGEETSYLKSIAKWDSSRIESLKAKNGWLNLAGLYWLKPGVNKIGSESYNQVVFPKGPGNVGSYTLAGEDITFIPAQGVGLTANGKPLTGEIKLNNDYNRRPTQFEINSLCWFLIKRGSKIGIRLRDYESDNLKNFTGIERFQVDLKWRIIARFIKNTTGKTIDIPDVLGNISHDTIPGIVQFDWEGKTYSLYPTGREESLFVVFGDKTNKIETYGGGRFLSIEKPDKDGKTWVDFNKAYNPPCCFTEFATCPLPPEENKLPFSVLAGEKSGQHH